MGTVFEIPENVSEITPEEIAKYPMSIQWGIVERQREDIRNQNTQQTVLSFLCLAVNSVIVPGSGSLVI